MNTAENIGLFGGTFDPPHIGHRSYYELEAGAFDRFIIIPTGDPPHKLLKPDSATAAQRLEMTALAFPECAVSDIEISRDGKSYTADTVRELMRVFPGVKFTLLMGTDMFESLEKWWDYEWLRENVSFKCLDRSVIPVSSSALRAQLPLRKGREYLQEKVYAYIVKHRLYGVKPDYAWLWEQAAAQLDDYRVRHTLGVEKAAVTLAERYGADGDEARTAAILHDITKLKSFEQHLTYLQSYGIIPFAQDLESQSVLHAISGAELAFNEYGVSDAVRAAIRSHTTGAPGMTLLQKIIYLADCIEENRIFPEVEELRRVAFTDIDRAMEESLQISIAEVKKKGQKLHPASNEAYEFYRLANLAKNKGG